MHESFLADITTQMENLRQELQQLESVADYHRHAMSVLGVNHKKSSQITVSASPTGPAGTSPDVAGKLKHDACAIALREIGGKAKTADVARWLAKNGYGKDDRIFHNTCYTAMNRRKDMFRKIGRGEWELLAA